MFAEPIVRVSESHDFSDALVVSCFPTQGMVSTIVAHHLIDQLDLEFVGGVRHPELPPYCLVKDGAPMPPVRLYSGEPMCKLDSCDRLVVVISELPIKESMCLPLTESLFKWSKRANIGAAVLIDAFSKDDQGDEYPDLLGVAATDQTRLLLNEEMEVDLLQEGMLGGMTGIMLGEARRRGLSLMAIIAGTAGDVPDARAAVRVIEKLDYLLPNIKLDAEPLLEQAMQFEADITGMVESRLATQSSSSDTSMFV